jgi:hypothetical protein
MISPISHDSSEGKQWGRYNLPRYFDSKLTTPLKIGCQEAFVGSSNRLTQFEMVNSIIVKPTFSDKPSNTGKPPLFLREFWLTNRQALLN